MPEPSSFDYAVVRIVPRVDREEFVNAGVVVFCLEQRFLEARVYFAEAKVKALCPEIDADIARQHLDAFRKVCAGDPAAGPIARLSQRERFHWLVAPRSTMIQTSPVHSGLCGNPSDAIDRLLRQLGIAGPQTAII